MGMGFVARIAVAGLLLIGAVSHATAQDLEIETVVDGLEHPWSLTWLPDGSMLVTERPGRLRIVRDGVLVDEPVAGLPPILAAGQGGLLDVLPAPDFDQSGMVYFSYSAAAPDGNQTRVAAGRLVDGQLHDVAVVFEGTSFATTNHFGSRLAWLPDGTLLVTTGEGFNYREQAQLLASRLGKTIRINSDGSTPADNPFVDEDGADPLIWTYGHRNPQGLAVDPATGTVYLHEHGPRGGDEVNVLEPGANYGWPIATFGIDYSGAQISPYQSYPGTSDPLLHWTPSIAPSGLAIYRGSLFADWDGDLLVGALAGQHLRRVDMEDGAVRGQYLLLDELEERIRDVRVGPDGAVYVVTDNPDGRILRLSPAS